MSKNQREALRQAVEHFKKEERERGDITYFYSGWAGRQLQALLAEGEKDERQTKE